MSSAFYPQGMNSYNNRVPQGGYESWKGKGVYSNPVGITSGNLRPLTNRDPANDALYKFGLPRPIKQYRRGISIPVPVPQQYVDDLGKIVNTYYYSDRQVKSSVQDNMVSQLMDTPGRFIVKDNKLRQKYDNLNEDCKTCDGIGIVSGWYPINNLTEKPQANVTNPLLCCNQQRKAKQRVLPPNTLLKKNYYTTTYQYLFNRCQTFDQRSFNFLKGIYNQNNVFNKLEEYPFVSAEVIKYTKPGDPLAYLNLYVANCNPNSLISATAESDVINKIANILLFEKIISQLEFNYYLQLQIDKISNFIDYLKSLPKDTSEKALLIAAEIFYNPYTGAFVSGPSNPKGCAEVFYKPNNPQFAKEGAVSSSTRTLQLNVTTIEKNASSIVKLRGRNTITSLADGQIPYTPFIYKNKVPRCNPGLYTKDGNPKTCFKNTNDIAKGKYNPVAIFGSVKNQLSDMTSIVNR